MRDTPTEEWFDRHAEDLVRWRAAYAWPGGGVGRDDLERMIVKDLRHMGCVSGETFDEVLHWGFGRRSGLTDDEIREATKTAFTRLDEGDLAGAASTLMKLPGIGISRASKVLSLSDQQNLGVYDSHAAHGLADLEAHGSRAIPIPPDKGGRLPRDHCSPVGWAEGYARFTAVLRLLHELAAEDPRTARKLPRVADVEMALFERSRSSAAQEPAP